MWQGKYFNAKMSKSFLTKYFQSSVHTTKPCLVWFSSYNFLHFSEWLLSSPICAFHVASHDFIALSWNMTSNHINFLNQYFEHCGDQLKIKYCSIKVRNTSGCIKLPKCVKMQCKTYCIYIDTSHLSIVFFIYPMSFVGNALCVMC